jgi:hypothetical protein
MSSTAEPSFPQMGPKEVGEPAPSAPGAAPKRAADHSDFQAWEAQMLAGAQRQARNEDERREAGKRLY